jgi:hypothetical protein
MNSDDTPLPDDEPTAAEMAAAGTIRPLEQLPSPWIVKGDPKVLSEPTLSALSPDQQKLVLERAGGTDAASLDRALKDFLLERSRNLRIICGPGEGATETEREALCQMNELRLLSEEHARIEAELAEVAEYRVDYAADGTPLPNPVPVYLHRGDLRSAKQTRLDEIKHQMSLVGGIQGETALNAAQKADALKARRRKSQLDEAAEIKRMGEALLREERVTRAAQSYAKHRRNTIS